MNKIKTILICLIIIFATCAICTGLIMMNEKTTTLKLSETCSINITGEYDTVFENGMNQIKIFDKFNNKEYKSIVVYSGANAGMQEIITFGMFKSFFVGNAWDTGAEPVKTQWNGDTVYVIYTGNNITHDNILIISKNRDDCIKMSAGKESARNAGDLGLIPGSGRSHGEGIGYLLQYSWASLVVQLVKNPPTMWETWV